MQSLTRNQVTETYLTSGSSLFSVCLFAFLKRKHLRSRKVSLVWFMMVWGLLEIVALILFSIEHSRPGNFPKFLAGAIPTILDTISFWGAAIVQIIAIIYPFAAGIGKGSWLKWLIILECLEITGITILAMVSRTPPPLQLDNVAPFTSQAAAIGSILLASRKLLSKGGPKQTADFLLGLTLLLMLVSALLLGLSLAGYYTASKFLQWFLYIMSSALGYRLAETEYGKSRRTGGNSDLEMNPSRQPGLNDSVYDNQSSASLNEDQALLPGPALPQPAVIASSNRRHLSGSG
ncbi:uncharacterized protein NECHADRAFT_89120 [Fusarium vanettenii 77-13-4]|uniref:Chitin synthase export chaperone n=1 Tax=Fusarium vanettenii (strain ATCC MYA-4622 / CBS 123669 / FGSC 9596 / NRRL 45880 / 77-13-4) TaxID=660122 RepID=C7ZQA3_FUSV7|nr:uncharacterized protein NECHADRAFT_89120 [Fusarium vanettenii 77-13-4]EEU33804.1 predicted protein [Fusarium vanettenii 77-13-4]